MRHSKSARHWGGTGARGAPLRSSNPATTDCPAARGRRPTFTAVRIPRRVARPFEWATRRSRVGTDRFGTGRGGTGSGVPTRLRRVARRRAGPARPALGEMLASGLPQVLPLPASSLCLRAGACAPFASITIRIMIPIRTLLGSTKFAPKLQDNVQLPKNNNPVTILAHTRPSHSELSG